MAKQTFEIEFDGYWREPNISGIPSESGIYCVYECTHNKEEKTVTNHKLIYIGESVDVNNRIANHEKWSDWKKKVSNGNEVCISVAKIGSTYRNRIEAALIFEHKPPVNTDCINEFNYDETTIVIKGKIGLLNNNFTVSKVESLW